jgi:hypothetical protein
MNNHEEKMTLKIKPRPQEMVLISIPKDTLKSLEKIARIRDMSKESLIKFYIGQGLREDLQKRFSEKILASTAQVLARYFHSETEIADIIKEIQTELMKGG